MEEKKVKLYARAKINLALDVINKMENGYHNLKTVFQSVNLLDTLTIEKIEEDKILIDSNISWFPKDKKNIIYTTASYLKENYGVKGGIKVYVKKNIPISAGLAGGSTDCAATLIGVRNLFKLPISNENLFEIGKTLGADVPFCLMRGTALAEGIGEKLKFIPPMPFCYIVIVKPSLSISTSSVFNNLDLNNIKTRPDIEKIIYYLKNGNLEKMCHEMENVLETVTIKKYPIINDIKNVLLENGALGSLMSGSGTSSFGIFTSKSQAKKAVKIFKFNHKIKDVFLTTPFNNYTF